VSSFVSSPYQAALRHRGFLSLYPQYTEKEGYEKKGVVFGGGGSCWREREMISMKMKEDYIWSFWIKLHYSLSWCCYAAEISYFSSFLNCKPPLP